MRTQTVKLINRSRTVIATAQVVEQNDGFTGRIDLSLMPLNLRQTFEEYEKIINGQIFSLLDEIEDEIGALRLKIRLETGSEMEIDDLQIYPATGRVSFVLVKEAVDFEQKELIPV